MRAKEAAVIEELLQGPVVGQEKEKAGGEEGKSMRRKERGESESSGASDKSTTTGRATPVKQLQQSSFATVTQVIVL
jgi:hypothetical protein